MRASLIRMSFDPVPLSPATCQTSRISYWDFSTRKVQKSIILPLPSSTGPPTNTQSAWSQPEDQDHLPLRRNPSSVLVAAPIGA